jgi:hypothetical protein
MTEYRQHYEHLLDMIDNYQGDRDDGSKLFDELYEYCRDNLPQDTQYDIDDVYAVIKPGELNLREHFDTIRPYLFILGLFKYMLTVQKIAMPYRNSIHFLDFYKIYGRMISHTFNQRMKDDYYKSMGYRGNIVRDQ